jgi:hypothetical protein
LPRSYTWSDAVANCHVGVDTRANPYVGADIRANAYVGADVRAYCYIGTCVWANDPIGSDIRADPYTITGREGQCVAYRDSDKGRAHACSQPYEYFSSDGME